MQAGLTLVKPQEEDSFRVTLRNLSLPVITEQLIVPYGWMKRFPDGKGKYGVFILDSWLRGIVAENGIEAGVMVVDCPHTTAGLLLQESEEGIICDLIRLAEKVLPQSNEWYRHNLVDARKNGSAHAMHALLGIGRLHVLRIQEGAISFGEFRSLILFDCDPDERQRTITVDIFVQKMK